VKFEPLLLNIIIVLANAYLEYTCPNPWEPPARRRWVYRRTVDLSQIALL